MCNFNIPWEKCSLCHQLYQHELAVDMANAQLRFIEENYPLMNVVANPINHMRYADALKFKLVSIKTMDPGHNPVMREEGKQTAMKYLSMIQEMQNVVGSSKFGCKSLSKSEADVRRGQSFEGVVRWGKNLEADAHQQIGDFLRLTKETYKEGIKHLQKARDIHSSIGDTSNAKLLDANIATIESQYAGTLHTLSHERPN